MTKIKKTKNLKEKVKEVVEIVKKVVRKIWNELYNMKQYRDPFGSKAAIFESKGHYLENKLLRDKTKFTMTYDSMVPLVAEALKSGKVSINVKRDMGVEYIAQSLPNFVLGFIEGSPQIRVRNTLIKECLKSDTTGNKTKGVVSFDLEKVS